MLPLQISELDYLALEYNKTYPMPPEELIEVRKDKRWILNGQEYLICKRCNERFVDKHICSDVYYHLWNMYIHFVRNKISDFPFEDVKERFGF